MTYPTHLLTYGIAGEWALDHPSTCVQGERCDVALALASNDAVPGGPDVQGERWFVDLDDDVVCLGSVDGVDMCDETCGCDGTAHSVVSDCPCMTPEGD